MARTPKPKAKAKPATKRKRAAPKKPAPLPVTLEEQRDALLAKMSVKERRFVERYALHEGIGLAYREAGNQCTERSSYTLGSRLLKRPDVREVMRLHHQIFVRDYDMGHDQIALRYWTTATAPVTDIVQHRRPPCRYCYGAGGEYQWRTPREYREAFDHAMAKLTSGMDTEAMAGMQEAIRDGRISDPSVPNDDGGYGYDSTSTPNNDCPECNGIGGRAITTITDTDLMSPAAMMLYDGIKETKDGIEVKLADRFAALEKLAKHLGMFTAKVDDEVINPLEALARRVMSEAQAVPVVPDDPAPAGFNLTQAKTTTTTTTEAAHDVPPEMQGDGYVEP